MVANKVNFFFVILLTGLTGCSYYTNTNGYIRTKKKYYFDTFPLVNIDTNSVYKLVRIKYLYDKKANVIHKNSDKYLKFYSNNKISMFRSIESKVINPSKGEMGYYYQKDNCMNIFFIKNHIQSGNYKVNYKIIEIKPDTIIMETKGAAMTSPAIEIYVNMKIPIDEYKIINPDW